MTHHNVNWTFIKEMCYLEGKITERFLQGQQGSKTKFPLFFLGYAGLFSALCQNPAVEQQSFPSGLQEWTGWVHLGLDICSDFSTPRECKTKKNSWVYFDCVISVDIEARPNLEMSALWKMRHNWGTEECIEKRKAQNNAPCYWLFVSNVGGLEHLWKERGVTQRESSMECVCVCVQVTVPLCLMSVFFRDASIHTTQGSHLIPTMILRCRNYYPNLRRNSERKLFKDI